MPKPKKQTLGQKLFAARKALGISQACLGDKAGMSQARIAEYEADTYDPSATRLRALAKALGVTPNDLLLD